MRIFSYTFTLFLLLNLSGCGGSSKTSTGDIPPTLEEAVATEGKYFSVDYPQSCSTETEKQFLDEVMHDSYFFADYLTEDINVTTYADTTALLDALRYEKDRYSFIMDAETLLKFYDEGKNENFGFDFFYAPVEGESYYYFIISYVYPDSPADQAGIKRGDMITSVNGLPIYDLQEAWNMFSEESTLSFNIMNYNEEEARNLTLTKTEYSIHTVLKASVLTQGEKKIGYLVFQDFITQAEGELDYYFNALKSNGVNELVLDLRYNGGGDTSVANYLATLIGGEKVYGKVFDHVLFNKKYATYNFKEYFDAHRENALDLKRVFIITTKATASASELVINALRSSDNGVEVIQIGSATYGKPYAFIPKVFCDQALLVVNTESKNGSGVGGYINGIEPTCNASDDLFKPLGDVEEPSLSEALYYVANNSCTPQTTTLNKADASSLATYPVPKTGFRQIMSAF